MALLISFAHSRCNAKFAVVLLLTLLSTLSLTFIGPESTVATTVPNYCCREANAVPNAVHCTITIIASPSLWNFHKQFSKFALSFSMLFVGRHSCPNCTISTKLLKLLAVRTSCVYFFNLISKQSRRHDGGGSGGHKNFSMVFFNLCTVGWLH